MYRREYLISWAVESLFVPGGYLLGRTFSGHKIWIEDRSLDRHVVVLGKTGSGKSNALRVLIREIINKQKGSVLLFDPHGDLASDIIQTYPDRSIMLPIGSLKTEEGEFAITMNPLQDAKENPEFYAGWIREAFISNTELSQGTWGPRLEVIFSSLMSEMIRIYDGPTLLILLGLLVDKSKMRHFLNSVTSPELASFFQLLMSDWRGWGQYVTSSVNKILPLLTDRGIRNLISGERDSTDFSALFNSTGNIIIPEVWKSNVSDEGFRVVSILILMKVWSLRMRSPSGVQTPLYIVFDEAQHVPQTVLDRLLREGRKFGLRLILATQYLGEESRLLRADIQGNVGTFLVFSMSGEDASRVAGIFFSGELRSKIEEIISNQPLYRAVFWTTDERGMHGPVTLVPEKFSVPEQHGEIALVRTQSVVRHGIRLETTTKEELPDLHQYLVDKISDYVFDHGGQFQTKVAVDDIVPDGIVDLDSQRLYLEVEVSDLAAFSKVLEKIVHYSGKPLIFLVPPGNASRLFEKIVLAVEDECSRGKVSLLRNIQAISIMEYQGGLKFFTAQKLKTLKTSYLKSGTFLSTIHDLGTPELRFFILDKIARRTPQIRREDIVPVFGSLAARRALDILFVDGQISIRRLFGVEK